MTNKKTISLTIIMLLLSGLLSLVGAFFKIQHYPYGAELLLISTLFWLVSIVLIIGSAVQKRRCRVKI